MKINPIILIAGEPKSIFFEIYFKSIKKKIKSPIILICCKELLLEAMDIHNVRRQIKILKIENLKQSKLNNKSINLVDIKLKKNLGHNQKAYINDYINRSLDIGFRIIKSGFTYKFINGPINKKYFLNKKFFGMTEFIANKFKKKKFGMLIYNEKLSVCPVTTHLPIQQVSKKLNKKVILEKIFLINEFFLKIFGKKPRIAVTGLNPHCESVLKYNEDVSIVKPAVKLAKKRGYNVDGPFSGDTIFLKENRKKYNVILGMYHDQVLGPIKTLFEYNSFNITLGLPFLRLTPDHGPNEKMINKKKSSHLSLLKALEFLDKN